jgi:hypothetical protein
MDRVPVPALSSRHGHHRQRSHRDTAQFSELTRDELTTLTAKMDRAAGIGEREGYDPGLTSEVHGVQADLYDTRAAAYNEARRQLTAQAKPKPTPNQNPHPDQRSRRLA